MRSSFARLGTTRQLRLFPHDRINAIPSHRTASFRQSSHFQLQSPAATSLRGQLVFAFTRALSSSTSVPSRRDYYAPVDIDAEAERLHSLPPTRVAGLAVAAGGSGRSDVLHRILATLDRTDSNRGLLISLLAQFVRLKDIDAVQTLVKRLAVIDRRNEAELNKMAETNIHNLTNEPHDGEHDHYGEEATGETRLLLDRPFAYYGAYKMLIAEHARKRDALALMQTLELLHRSNATVISATMRQSVKEMINDVGLLPFLALIKPEKFGSESGPATVAIRNPHPSTLGMLVRCAVVLPADRLRAIRKDALRLGHFTSMAMKSSSINKNDNITTYRTLLMFYRKLGVKVAIEELLVSFSEHKVVVTPAMLAASLPGLRFEQLDRVLDALRTKGNPFKPSVFLYTRIAKNMNYNETVAGFRAFVINNFLADHPDQSIGPYFMNRALLVFARALQVSRAASLFNLMQPRSTKLPESDINIFDQERPMCEADEETYTIFMTMMERLVVQSEQAISPHVKPDPCWEKPLEEKVGLARQVYDIARKRLLTVPEKVYLSMIQIYIAAKQVGLADVIFYQMRQVGFVPPNEVYEQLIKEFNAVGNKTAANNLQHELQRIERVRNSEADSLDEDE